jgi:hypothetical protein
VLSTYVVNEIAAIPSQGKQLVTVERRDVTADALNNGHEEGRGNETGPLVIDEGERFGTETKDDTRSHTHSQEERGEG